MTQLAELKEELASACRVIGRLHLTREPNGHLSARIPGTDMILVKARGASEAPLTFTQSSDLAVIDMNGDLIEARDGLAPPSEIYIHTEVLRARQDVDSVIHVHPQAVVAFTIANKPISPVVGAYNPSALRLVVDGIPTYPKSILINTPQRGSELAETMGQSRVCLMKAHGLTAVGRSIEESALTAIQLNDLAELQQRAILLGGADAIPPSEVDDILGNLPPDVRRDSPAFSRSSSEWRYYLQMYG